MAQRRRSRRPHVDHDPGSFVRLLSTYRTDSTAQTLPAASTLGDFLTCGFFDVYSPVTPLAGRMPQNDDCAARAPGVVISDVTWRDEFGSAPDVVGRVLRAAGTIIRRFPGLVAAPQTLDAELALVTDAFQRIGAVVGAVAVITALLAIVGVYGVIGLAAKRRLKEMGIRVALGARRADVYRAMVGPNARPVGIGLVVGAALSTALAVASDRVLAAVFPVRIFDPFAFLLAAFALAAVSAVAMMLPARRATAVDPSRVLRQE